jgi:SAM-dependent methyltransferase
MKKGATAFAASKMTATRGASSLTAELGDGRAALGPARFAEIAHEGADDAALVDAMMPVSVATRLSARFWDVIGAGRDVKVFAELGHIAIGLEGAAHFATMARAYSGCEVWQQDFLKLDLPGNYFDGVFANASLFHVPSQELPRVLLELRACLKPGGVLFSSNPHGHNEEGWNHGRYGAYHDLETWRRFVSSAGFVELTHYYRPTGVPPERQPWLASIWRR